MKLLSLLKEILGFFPLQKGLKSQLKPLYILMFQWERQMGMGYITKIKLNILIYWHLSMVDSSPFGTSRTGVSIACIFLGSDNTKIVNSVQLYLESTLRQPIPKHARHLFGENQHLVYSNLHTILRSTQTTFLWEIKLGMSI